MSLSRREDPAITTSAVAAGAGGVVDLSVQTTSIEGLFIITMRQVEDDRGVVREFHRQSAWVDAGLPEVGPWLQVNVTETQQGALRGLHGEAMNKLVAVAAGEAFGAYVDTRPDSPSFGKTVTVFLEKGHQVLVPQGVCNGFQAVSSSPTQYVYCLDAEWTPGMPGIAVNALDPELGIEWPIFVDPADRFSISEKDATLPTFAEATSR
jgi:dTDP-4-dehydrorhamnose 3,5-epimerase